jgi:hypothetical protein
MAIARSHPPGQMRELSCFGVFFGHVFQTELLRLEKRILFVQRGVVEKLTRGNAQGCGYGFDDIRRGVLATLLDVAQVALGDPGLVGQSLQRELPVCPQPADRKPYVVCESPLGHCLAPELEGCRDVEVTRPYALQCMRWHARMQP